jgi:SRSO17 transposase
VFKSKTHHFQDHALKYVEGLFKSPKGRATCYFMGHTLEGNDGQHLNHLLTQSPWDHFKLFELIQRRSTQLLRKHKQPTYLLIDEVGFRKKGTSSACVAKPYLGSMVQVIMDKSFGHKVVHATTLGNGSGSPVKNSNTTIRKASQ